MKKKIVLIFAGVAVAVVISFTIHLKNNIFPEVSLLIANVEALTQSENGGTAVGTCKLENVFSSFDHEWAYSCDKQTSNSMIYPCPVSQTYGRFSGSDRCTK